MIDNSNDASNDEINVQNKPICWVCWMPSLRLSTLLTLCDWAWIHYLETWQAFDTLICFLLLPSLLLHISTCLLVCLFVCLFVCVSICPRLSVPLSINLSIYLFSYLSMNLLVKSDMTSFDSHRCLHNKSNRPFSGGYSKHSIIFDIAMLLRIDAVCCLASDRLATVVAFCINY